MSWSAVAPDAVLVLVRASAEVAVAHDAESWVTEVAVLGTPRMKLPPVAAMPISWRASHPGVRVRDLCRWFTMDRR